MTPRDCIAVNGRVRHPARHAWAVVVAGLVVAGVVPAPTARALPVSSDIHEANMHEASGTFTVALQPDPGQAGAGIGRMHIDKRYSGGLQAQGTGTMLTGAGGVPGSAAYVAMEHVDGTLDGRRGGFLLVHRGVMDRGAASLQVQIVPDSGTGALQGIAGTLDIAVDGGTHRYTLHYRLP